MKSSLKSALPTEAAQEPLTFLQQSIGNRGIQSLIKSVGIGGLVQPAPREDAPTTKTASKPISQRLPQGSAGDLLQRFGYQEHQLVGDKATGGQKLVLYEGDPQAGIPKYEISFGEMVALAGDYFEDLAQMKRLAKSVLGQRKLDYARSKGGKVPEPSNQELSPDEKKKMDKLYYELNGKNYMHFSEPTVHDNNLRFYLKKHQEIVQDLFQAGQQKLDKNAVLKDAMMKEGFNAHFLTDAFCGGHITAPREGADEHWKKIYPLFLDNFFHHISEKIAEHINNQEFWRGLATIGIIKSKVIAQIIDKKPPGVDNYSLGGLISLAVHDYYNAHGLDVVSKVDASGNTPAGGFKWTAYGEAKDKTLDQSIAATQQGMVIAAVKAGIADLETAYNCQTLEELKTKVGPPFKVEGFVPQADASSTSNINFQWKYNTIGDLIQDTQMMGAIKDLFGPSGNVGSLLVGLTKDKDIAKDASVKGAIELWIKRLQTDTGKVLQEIAEYVPGFGRDHFSTDRMSRDYVADMKKKDKLDGATTGQMIGLIKRMLDGSTGDDDERAILDVLRAANKKGNVWAVMNGVGHFWGLEPKFQGAEWHTLLVVLSEKYFREFSANDKYTHVKWLVDNTSREWGEEACIAILNCATTAEFKEIVTKIGKKRLDKFLDGAEQDRFDTLLKMHGYGK
jgi:hypothetical protein